MSNIGISRARSPEHALVNTFTPGHPLLAWSFLRSVFIYTTESKR